MTLAATMDLAQLAARGPHFAPDATYGAVRAVGSDELADLGIQLIMTNAFHLMLKPGISTLTALGGAKGMTGWNGLLATDSGGFQTLSLIRENSKYGKIEDDGLVFIPEGGRDRILLSPEKSIQNQLRLGGDIMFCLDDCTYPASDEREQEVSVRRTLAWAKACRKTFDEIVARRPQTKPRPSLFAVVQGGRNLELRRRCAEGLLEIGFDGFGFGGWPLDADGNLVADMLEFTRECIPDRFPMHALGVGHPASISLCSHMGYAFFDSALPTRDGRRGRLYSFRSENPDLRRPGREWFRMHYLQDDIYMKSSKPISTECQAACCRHYSAGYLHHLFRIDDPLYLRLGTLHNLDFMMRLGRLLASQKDVSA